MNIPLRFDAAIQLGVLASPDRWLYADRQKCLAPKFRCATVMNCFHAVWKLDRTPESLARPAPRSATRIASSGEANARWLWAIAQYVLKMSPVHNPPDQRCRPR